MATVTLTTMKADWYRHQGQYHSGTATGGAAGNLIDTSLINLSSETFPFPLKGRQVRITSGSASGDLRLIADTDPTGGILYPHRAFSAAIASTNTYDVLGTSIEAGTPLTNLFNDVLRRLRALTHTAVTIVTSQEVYDITTLVPTYEDVVAVYLRLLDPASLTPYTRVDLDAQVWNDAGAGTTVVRMRIPAQTLNAAINTLHVEHYTSFTALASDASTVDAVYRDWIVWEAIATFAGRQLLNPKADRAYWQQLLANAFDSRMGNLDNLRERFDPRKPIRIRAVEW